ncbi:hypothetical protein EGW08_020351 [Elysia chlorotica]|uniref:Ig-like domain-containing protein n=1 Tax=Elysia chlorotica TaxID=188477 RepID=A0A433SRI2_ELYCH|nr:hypothetical protein EGW08_020351 [Elysia chlorotica]
MSLLHRLPTQEIEASISSSKFLFLVDRSFHLIIEVSIHQFLSFTLVYPTVTRVLVSLPRSQVAVGSRQSLTMTSHALVNVLILALVAVDQSRSELSVRIEPNVRKLLVPEGSSRTFSCIVERHPNNGDKVLWISPYDKDQAGETKPEVTYYFGNDSVLLYCKANLKDAVFQEWRKDNTTLEAGEKYELHDNGSLTVMKLDRDDAGQYMARYTLSNDDNKIYDCVVDYRDKLAWLYPFVGIIAQIVVLVLLIILFEKIKKKNDSEPGINVHE